MRKSEGPSISTPPQAQLRLDPAKTEFITLEQLENPVVRFGASYWLSLRGTKCFPARDLVNVRDVGNALSHMMLIKVIEGGADFELRVVGDAIARALRVPVHKRRLGDIAGEAPLFAERNFKFYRSVVESRKPLAMRTYLGPASQELKYTHVEALILPLGSRDDLVDYLLAFASYVSRFV
ncbi:MAG: PAS domain-containing protein [Alphaproteobacteria bacterium]|nr:PAS domain-containing protein [Alphaproteobacteria bacterium]